MNERLLILAANEIAGTSEKTINGARERVAEWRECLFGLLRQGGTFKQIDRWKAEQADCDAWIDAASRLEERNKSIERFREKVRNAPVLVLSDEERAHIDKIEAEAKEQGYVSNGEMLLGLLTRAREDNARLTSLLQASEDPIIRSLARAPVVPGTPEELAMLRRAEEDDAFGTRKYNNGMPILESLLGRFKAEHDRVKVLVEKWRTQSEQGERIDAPWASAVLGCANELATTLDEPVDAPVSDPAERANAVAKELRRRGIWTTWRAHSDGIVRTMGFGPLLLGAEENDVECMTHYMNRSDYPAMGPHAIADHIQAEEAKRAKKWAGDG